MDPLIKITESETSDPIVYSLSVNNTKIAELTVREKEEKKDITLELLVAGEFQWSEARNWITGLMKLTEFGDAVYNSKPDVERLLHQPSDKEIDMAKAKAKAKQKKVDKKAGKPVAPRETAAAMFQELIMDGKFTDDQIFAKVKAKFKLDDKKRSYVAWYRNKLGKDGKKPPTAKE